MQCDQNLIRRIAKGDADAFEALCCAYSKRLYGFLYRIVGSHSKTEEALNDTFFKIWRGASGFRGDAAVATWIFSIARHTAFKMINNDHMTEPLNEQTETECALEQSLITKDLVDQGLAALKQPHREVIELAFFSGLSMKEIANIVKVPINTVKTRMFHARQQLRRTIRGFGKRGAR